MSDKVNNPEHYNHGGIESIDVIEAKGHLRGFCYGNVMKYVHRAPFKDNELEDLKKAQWYLAKLIRDIEG